MSILSNEAACMECTHGGAFMHGKGFIKFKLRFNSSLEMFFKEIKALQNISLFDVWNAIRSQDHFG
jgi:hypothetical protein